MGDSKVEALARAFQLPTPSINEAIKATVVYGLSLIPNVGSALGALVSLLWPSDPSKPWEVVRREVETMVKERINDLVYNMIRNKVNGAMNALALFLTAVKNKKNDEIRIRFSSCMMIFANEAPQLQIKQNEWATAPLYAIWAHLHVSLLREGVEHGKSWGWDGNTWKAVADDFVRWITEHNVYLKDVSTRRIEMLKHSVPAMNKFRTNVYNYWQPSIFQYVTLIHDYSVLLYAQRLRHNNRRPLPFADVFSRAYGTADNFDPEEMQWSKGTGGVGSVLSKPLRDFTEIHIEEFSHTPIVVRVSHPRNSGPMLWNQSNRRLDQYNILSRQGWGIEKKTVNFPGSASDRLFRVRGARVRESSIPLSLVLVLDSGREEWMWDGREPGSGTWHNVLVEGRMLSTLNMWTRSSWYGQVLGCIIFGFSHDPLRPPPQKALRARFIGAIEEPEGISGENTDEDLQRERGEFWKSVMLCAEQ